MKLKDYILIMICFIGFGMSLYTKKPLISITGISIIYICCISVFMYSVLKWNKNKKQINTDYINLKIDNFLYEFLMLFTIYLNLKTKYISRSINLEFIHNKIVEINNFKDYINTYCGTEKILNYMLIAFQVGLIISITKKILCKGRISSDKALLSNGELIYLKDIKNTSFPQIEENLNSLDNNK